MTLTLTTASSDEGAHQATKVDRPGTLVKIVRSPAPTAEDIRALRVRLRARRRS